jgi:hypothetical protein
VKRRPWTEDEIETVRINYADWPTYVIAHLVDRSERAVFQQAQNMGLRKSERYMREHHGAFIVAASASRGTRFKPGHTSWNKGRKGSTGLHPNCRKSQFAKGQMPHTWRPIGHMRVTREGVLEIKVRDTRVTRDDYAAVPRLVWEREVGPIPNGHCVVFKPGQHTTEFRDITLDRLDCIDRAENMRRNSFWNRYPKEVANLIQLRGALNRQINKRAKA